MHQLQIGSPSGTTCIGSKFGHQLAPLALLPKLATSNTCIATLPSIALLALSVSIELVSSSARVTSVKSTQRSRSDGRTSGPKDRTPGLPGSDKNFETLPLAEPKCVPNSDSDGLTQSDFD